MMDLPWIVLTVLAIGAFAVFEAMAFRHPDRVNTLSRSIYDLGSKWPLSIWIMGVFCGSLATHFFWHYCPPGSISTGMLDIFMW
jgi:predicted outer membrane lipoprotein